MLRVPDRGAGSDEIYARGVSRWERRPHTEPDGIMRIAMRRFGPPALAIIIALICGSILPGVAWADEYDSVFERLLFSPSDPALNIRYAELAEANGELRKALGAYERVLAQDPYNSQVLSKYRRVKNLL